VAGRRSYRPDANVVMPTSFHLVYHGTSIPGLLPGFGHSGLGGRSDGQIRTPARLSRSFTIDSSPVWCWTRHPSPAWRRFFAELSPRPRGAGSARWASSVRAMSRFRHQYRSTVCTCSSPFVIAGNNPVAGINRSNRGCLLNPYPDAAAGRPKHPLAPTRRRPPESYIIRLCAVRIQDQTQFSQNR